MRAVLRVDSVRPHEHADGTASVLVEGRDPITGERNRIGVLCGPGEQRPRAGDTIEHVVTLQLMPRKVRRIS